MRRRVLGPEEIAMQDARRLTAEEFAELPDDGNMYELVRGKLVMMSRPDWRHGQLALRIGALLLRFVEEIVSKSDRESAVHRKALEYLAAGARRVWAVHPRTAAVQDYRAGGKTSTLSRGDSLDGEDVLPGLSLSLDLIFR